MRTAWSTVSVRFPGVLAAALVLSGCLRSQSTTAVGPTRAARPAPALARAVASPSASAAITAGSAAQAPEPSLSGVGHNVPDVAAYTSRKNYASVTFGSYASSHGYPSDQFERVEFGLHHGRSTLVMGLSRVHRFGLIDSGLSAYLYSGFTHGYWGYLYAAYNPNSRFLARTAYGAELDRDMGSFGWSLGYRRMLFAQDSVDLYMPSVTYYFSDNLSLSGRLFYVPVSGAYSLVVTPVYQDVRHDRYYVALSVGDLAARSGVLQDFQRYPGGSVALGAERRVTPRFSLGADVLFEHRAGLYDRHGLDVYAKTWW